MYALELFRTIPTSLPTTLEECLKIKSFQACLAAILEAQATKGTGGFNVRLSTAAKNLRVSISSEMDPQIRMRVYDTGHLLFELARQGVGNDRNPATSWGVRANMRKYTHDFLSGDLLRGQFYDPHHDGATQREAFRVLGFSLNDSVAAPGDFSPQATSRGNWRSDAEYQYAATG